MESIEKYRGLLKLIMDMIEKQFGKNCECVLHDFSLGYDKSIVDIRNGHITGRQVGGCATNLGLEIMSGLVEGGSRYNYITYTQNGNIMRSSSLHFYNSDNTLVGALCINLDITQSVKYETYLKEFNSYSLCQEQVTEFFVSDVQQLLDELIRQAYNISNKSVDNMSRDDKIKFIKFLDSKGAFFITKSSEKICEELQISKFTLYKYLDIARENNNSN